MSSNIMAKERSAADGAPVELYTFACDGVEYLFTSDARDVAAETSEGRRVFRAETITREDIRQGGSGSAAETVIKANRDSALARLFTGPPPETPVAVCVHRAHESDLSQMDCVLRAAVSEVRLNGSECELHCTLDAFLQKEVPHGLHQHVCPWTVFDGNCGLDRSSYAAKAMLAEVRGNVELVSRAFASHPDGYYDGGLVRSGSDVRQIERHVGDTCAIKYPFATLPVNYVEVLPGCDGLFATCHERYGNTANFGGAPYCPPTDPEKNPTGQGAYWIDDAVIQRDSEGRVDTM